MDDERPMRLGIVGEAVVLAGVVVLTVIDGWRALRRWPMPATLGTLTNSEIDECLR